MLLRCPSLARLYMTRASMTRSQFGACHFCLAPRTTLAPRIIVYRRCFSVPLWRVSHCYVITKSLLPSPPGNGVHRVAIRTLYLSSGDKPAVLRVVRIKNRRRLTVVGLPTTQFLNKHSHRATLSVCLIIHRTRTSCRARAIVDV